MVPKIHGLDKYQGNLIHSHNYRLWDLDFQFLQYHDSITTGSRSSLMARECLYLEGEPVGQILLWRWQARLPRWLSSNICAILKQNPFTACSKKFQNNLSCQVYLAHNNPPLGSRMPRNVEQVDFFSMDTTWLT